MTIPKQERCTNCKSPTRPRMADHLKCEYCHTTNKSAQNRLFDRRKAAGLCPRCGKAPCLPGLKNCQACTDYGMEHQKRPESKLARKRNYRILRRTVYDHYGGKCACCGESAYNFLTIDHINGDGNRERKRGEAFMRDIQRSGYPTDLQVLCYNCNCSRGHHGFCHGTDPLDID